MSLKLWNSLIYVQYYKPWELQSDEEDRIERQIADAEAQVDREAAEFGENKRKWQKENGYERAETANTESGDTIHNEPEDNDMVENDSQEVPDTVGAKPTPSDATAKPTNVDTANNATDDNIDGDHTMQDDAKDLSDGIGADKEVPDDDAMKDAGEENVDHVEDAGEDAVIY